MSDKAKAKEKLRAELGLDDTVEMKSIEDLASSGRVVDLGLLLKVEYLVRDNTPSPLHGLVTLAMALTVMTMKFMCRDNIAAAEHNIDQFSALAKSLARKICEDEEMRRIMFNEELETLNESEYKHNVLN